MSISPATSRRSFCGGRRGCRRECQTGSASAFSESIILMNDGILGRVEQSLADFRPKTQREFVALQIARRFGDVNRLARYLLVAQSHGKKVMLEAARLAMLQHELNRTSTSDLYFEVIERFDAEGRT